MYTMFYCSLADSQKGSDASWKDDIEVPTEVHIIRSSVVPIVEVPHSLPSQPGNLGFVARMPNFSIC